jgi:branched-chain amino acid transport system permease protein
MDIYIQLLINSLQISSVYILFSLGLTLIFGVMKVVNFAHGEFFTFVLMLMAVVLPLALGWNLPLPLAYLLAAMAGMLGTLVLGKIIYEYGFKKYQRDMIGTFVLSVGLSLLLQGIFLEVFGGMPRKLPSLIDGTVQIMGGAITTERLVLTIAALLVAVVTYWLIVSTKLGKALRAVAEDHEAAMLQGIPYKKIALAGFLIATLLATIGAVLMSPVTVITPIIGNDYLIRGFIAIVIGGLGSIPGSILGSIIIAVIESVGGYYFDPSKATIAMFVIAALVLLIRPKGLMGHG